MKALKEILISVAFMVILIIPITESLFHFVPEKEIKENRKLKTKPEFDITNLDSYPKAFDEYYTDNFDLRQQFILFNSRLKIQLLNVPPISKKAFMGNEGWMYFIQNMSRVYLGKDTVTDEKLERYFDIINYRKNFLDSVGCKYYVVIVPVKTSVYPEFLPVWQRKPGQVSLTNQVVSLLDTVEGLNVIDLRTTLNNAKGDIRLFHKTDSHWNAYGSLIAYEAIMKTISNDFPEIIPNSISDFNIDSVIVDGMNLTKVLGIYHETHESKITCEPTFKKESRKGQKRDYPVHKRFSLKSEYEIVFTVENDSLPKMLMIRDSFARSLIPFISEHFSESVYIFDEWHHGLNEDIVLKEKPDIYIQLVAESLIPSIYKYAKKPL